MTVQGNLQWSCLSICSFLCKICEFYKLAQIVMWGSPRRPCQLGTRHVVRLPSRGLEKTNSHIIFILKMLLLADAAEFRSMLSSNILLLHLSTSNIIFFSRRQWWSYQLSSQIKSCLVNRSQRNAALSESQNKNYYQYYTLNRMIYGGAGTFTVFFSSIMSFPV